MRETWNCWKFIINSDTTLSHYVCVQTRDNFDNTNSGVEFEIYDFPSLEISENIKIRDPSLKWGGQKRDSLGACEYTSKIYYQMSSYWEVETIYIQPSRIVDIGLIQEIEYFVKETKRFLEFLFWKSTRQVELIYLLNFQFYSFILRDGTKIETRSFFLCAKIK